jgi:hypothetical protein
MSDNISPSERHIDSDFSGSVTEAKIERREPVNVQFKTGDGPEFRKPDHDPHGETFAADLDHLLVAVSKRLECSADDFEDASDSLL